jgi:hypothetical protein
MTPTYQMGDDDDNDDEDDIDDEDDDNIRRWGRQQENTNPKKYVFHVNNIKK